MAAFAEKPIAVIGMACRLPGAANLDEFWQLLVDGRSAIVEAPPSRIDRRLYYDAQPVVPFKTYNVRGGLIDYPPFDAMRCPTPERIMPQCEVGHLTICQVAADACRHAKLNPFDLPLRNVGVYIGHNIGGPVGGRLIYRTNVANTARHLLNVDAFREIAGDQPKQLVDKLVACIRAELPRRTANGTPECATRLASMVISEALGLTGPSMILDAACSSALQGLAMASRRLQLGRIDMAIVGGASFYHVDGQMIFSRAQSASRRGVSSPFDMRADGLIPSEGYVAVVVKTLDRALADGDPIQCVIRGIGVASDGRGKSLWAPRKEGQILAMRRAYQSDADIARLQFVEAHATSTRVGDVTELSALADVLTTAGVKLGSVAIGAVKANLGHVLEPAGLVGLVKTALAMQRQTIPKQIHFEQPNAGIDWKTAPFHVPVENVAWPAPDDGGPRRAAVNSFGIGGLNVHVALDEHVSRPVKRATRSATPSTSVHSTAHEPIAIVGAGCVLPGARSLEALRDLIASQRDARCEAPSDRWQSHVADDAEARQLLQRSTLRGGFVTDYQFDWRRHKLPPIQVAKMDPLQLMVLDATDAALTDAGVDRATYDKQRVGVVVGTVFGGDFNEQLQMGFRLPDFCDSLATMLREQGVNERQIEEIGTAFVAEFLKHVTALLDETGSFTSSTLASRLTKTFDFMGGAATIDAGNASSTAAISAAIDMLHDGTCDMVVCAAGSRAMSLSTYEFLASSGQLASDTNESGDTTDVAVDGDALKFLPGEGAGVVVLKRLSDARRAGHRIRGVIQDISAGFAADATAAVAQAASRLQSPVETSSPHVGRSLVDQIGYTHGASGMASLFASMFALERSKKSSGHAIATIDDLDSYGAAYRLVLSSPTAEVEPQRPTEEPAVAKPTPAEPSPTWRIVRLEADSLEALREELQRATENVEPLWSRESSFGSKAYRFATVADTSATLLKKLQLAAEALATEKRQLLARHDIFIGTPTDDAKIAFVFSGQGSQYAGMLKPLVEQVPQVADAMREIDAVLARHGMPSFATMAWIETDGLGVDVLRTQVSILCADMLALRAVESLGIRADFVAGHSFGEFAALAAAGAWDFENALLGTIARCRAIEACDHVQGAMLSVAAPVEEVERLRQLATEPVFAANLNAPDQTVIAGTRSAVDHFESLARSHKVACKRLAVPRPFHSPLMADVRAPLAEGLASVTMNAPRIPIISTVTVDRVVSGDAMRANLLDQLTSPVRYTETVAKLAEMGARIFIEVGPQRILTGLNERILANRDAVALSTDDKSRPGIARLLAIEACLDVHRLEKDAAEELAPHVTSKAYELGRQRGRAFTSTIRGVARAYADACGTDVEMGTAVSSAEDSLNTYELDQLRGIADELGVSLTMLRHLHTAQQMGLSTSKVVAPDAVNNDWTLPFDEPPASPFVFELTSVIDTPATLPLPEVDVVAAPSSTSSRLSGDISFDECYARMQSVDGCPPFESSGRVCERFELRLLPTCMQAIDEAWRTLSGPALIVGRNPVAMALRHEIERLGTKAIVIPLSDEIDVTLAAVDTIWKSYQPRHLFFVTAHDTDATTTFDAEHWATRRHRGVMLPYLVCQRWFTHLAENNLVERSSVIAATTMGGDFRAVGDRKCRKRRDCGTGERVGRRARLHVAMEVSREGRRHVASRFAAHHRGHACSRTSLLLSRSRGWLPRRAAVRASCRSRAAVECRTTPSHAWQAVAHHRRRAWHHGGDRLGTWQAIQRETAPARHDRAQPTRPSCVASRPNNANSCVPR